MVRVQYINEKRIGYTFYIQPIFIYLAIWNSAAYRGCFKICALFMHDLGTRISWPQVMYPMLVRAVQLGKLFRQNIDCQVGKLNGQWYDFLAFIVTMLIFIYSIQYLISSSSVFINNIFITNNWSYILSRIYSQFVHSRFYYS